MFNSVDIAEMLSEVAELCFVLLERGDLAVHGSHMVLSIPICSLLADFWSLFLSNRFVLRADSTA